MRDESDYASFQFNFCETEIKWSDVILTKWWGIRILVSRKFQQKYCLISKFVIQFLRSLNKILKLQNLGSAHLSKLLKLSNSYTNSLIFVNWVYFN